MAKKIQEPEENSEMNMPVENHDKSTENYDELKETALRVFAALIQSPRFSTGILKPADQAYAVKTAYDIASLFLAHKV